MSAVEQDLMKLYSPKILALAAEIPHAERLEAPMATAKKRSPLCGSTVTIDLDVEGGRVTRFGQDVKACALGQAAASVLGSGIVGLDRAAIAKGAAELKALIKEGGAEPGAPFSKLEYLRPAQDYKNRHASIMLAFEATLEAFDDALARAA